MRTAQVMLNLREKPREELQLQWYLLDDDDDERYSPLSIPTTGHPTSCEHRR